MTESDIFKISALDWLNFFEQQRAEFLLQCNAIVFAFLTVGKVECAQNAMEKLPHDIVASLVNYQILKVTNWNTLFICRCIKKMLTRQLKNICHIKLI